MKNAATGFFRNETVCVSCNTNVELPFDHIAASPPHSLEMLLLSASVGFASQPGFACGTRLQDICDGCTENGPGDSFFSFLTLDQFHSTWTQGGFDLVVDVRSAEAYADGHIPGAFNAPAWSRWPQRHGRPLFLFELGGLFGQESCGEWAQS